MSVASNDFLHIWKSYNETNSQFLETYRSIQTRSNTVATSNARTSNRRTNHSDTTTPSWLQQLFSSGRSPYISDISYSWVFEVPTSSSTTSQSRLTQKQIQENTRTFVYNENDANLLMTTTCPISQNSTVVWCKCIVSHLPNPYCFYDNPTRTCFGESVQYFWRNRFYPRVSAFF